MSKIYFIYSSEYTMDWAEHVFPVRKFEMVYEKLIKDGVIKKEDFIEPKYAAEEELLLVHTKRYLDELDKLATNYPGMVYAEIPITKAIINTFKLTAGGSIITARKALENGAAGHIGGGFHHAFSGHGEGFCFLNDMAIAIRVLQKEKLIKTAAVVDCDLHQGNGTAGIFRGDRSVYTFSIHQEHNYPIKEKSDWDIGLDDFVGDDEYLDALKNAVPEILERVKPNLLVYQAGADPYKEDQLGLLKMTKEGIAERDRFIYSEAKERNIPVALFLGGGYAFNMQDVVDIHFNTFKILKEMFSN